MTPLTLMRWDWDDSPRVGGDAGCGCGGPAAGALIVESLEELGPDLTFEGALASYGAADLEVRLFYAIPRRAIETSYLAHSFGGTERARYSREIAGAELRWQRLDRRTGSFWKAAAHAIASFENRRSVDFSALGYFAADPWTDTRTLSFTAEAPIVRYARLRGEILAWNDTRERGVVTAGGLADVSRRGGGGYGGIVVEKKPGASLRVDYLRLARGFSTPYSALSYEENTEGIRAVGADAVARRSHVALSLPQEAARSGPRPVRDGAEADLSFRCFGRYRSREESRRRSRLAREENMARRRDLPVTLVPEGDRRGTSLRAREDRFRQAPV